MTSCILFLLVELCIIMIIVVFYGYRIIKSIMKLHLPCERFISYGLGSV